MIPLSVIFLAALSLVLTTGLASTRLLKFASQGVCPSTEAYIECAHIYPGETAGFVAGIVYGYKVAGRDYFSWHSRSFKTEYAAWEFVFLCTENKLNAFYRQKDPGDSRLALASQSRTVENETDLTAVA